MDIIKEAELLLEKCRMLSVSSITEKGYPRVCILAKVKAEGCKTFYFSTAASSKKITHYKKNPKAGVTFYDGNDTVTLLGKMIVIEDKKTKDSLWDDWMAPHFPNGGKNDPEYAIIRFDAEEATAWLKGKFEIIKLT